MKLNNPVTITRPDNSQIIIKDLHIIIIDSCSQKIVMARLLPVNTSVILWQDEEYDSVGDYTQSQVEDKILMIMGDDQEKFLQKA